jgi:Outer membrane protein beta-barrel domain
MKTWIVLLTATACLFACSTPAQGQAALLALLFGDKVATENFHFGLKVGGNMATLSGLDEGNHNLGLSFGLAASIKLSDSFILAPEFLPLSHKGIKDIPALATGNADLDDLLENPSSTVRKLNYLDIPVILQYKVNEKISVGAGPQFSFLLSAADHYEADIFTDDKVIHEEDLKDKLNSFDMGAIIDFMYVIKEPTGGKGINLHLRYEYGVMDIVKDNPGDAVRNSVFQFALEFPFLGEGE